MAAPDIAQAITAIVATRRGLRTPQERRRLRQSAELSAIELATILGVSRQTIGNWETGRREPRADEALNYVKALDTLAALESQEPT